MANLCERMGGDINDVRRGIGHDSRIGFAFLFPGVGYGGSCFPKDVRALEAMAVQHGCEPAMLRAVDAVNERQKRVMAAQDQRALRRQARRQDDRHLGPGVQAADRRHSRSAGPGADRLAARAGRQSAGSRPRGDGQRPGRLRRQDRLLRTADGRASKGADALAIMTEWKDYHSPDFAEMYQLLKSAGDLRRPQSVRARADATPRVLVPQHRPGDRRRPREVSFVRWAFSPSGGVVKSIFLARRAESPSYEARRVQPLMPDQYTELREYLVNLGQNAEEIELILARVAEYENATQHDSIMDSIGNGTLDLAAIIKEALGER